MTPPFDFPGRVLLSGASGVIGSSFVRAAPSHRIHTFPLVRRKPLKENEIEWNPQSSDPVADPSRLEAIDAVLHLSGANVAAHRWTKQYREEIFHSRVDSTRHLVRLLQTLKNPPRLLLCASATGLYGSRGEEILNEDSAPGHGFLAETCQAWEAAAHEARQAGIRVVSLRFGIVLAHDGALAKMLPAFRLGLGARLGNGRQWMSWITLTDLLSALFHILRDDSIAGPVNLTAPQPVTNAEFTRALGRALHRPAILAAPAFALRLALGGMAEEGLLASTRVLPARLLRAGFTFEAPDIATALADLL
ncbi:TIGR01777 family oxidoreductase [Paracidobacterium acidisoli]|uniref:TIGR01777 family protein n=1 Tax=Paracidobacterium acidisoli TaxID=2303751 RepID=A0A372IPZ6_9BACT|nr:TIGR01777 family oxidoreductase [Paracidobacterium acidisoli]MBT9331384.1 TIGR01777 family oxidoreductase [Paracidobacterium acidisoli]